MRSVFISSTFKDMQAERDFLHEKIFPRLRKIISQYGEDIQELDLRWGVDTYNMTEEESGYQVLRVCVDAIDRCKPYIIVLLGDRYGWIPDMGAVESLKDERILNQYEENMSITNLEIKYGALSEEETLERCIFCFRDSGFLEEIPEDKRAVYMAESPLHEKKLSLLKQKIRAKANAHIVDYKVQWDSENQVLCSMDAFGTAIAKKMEELLRADFEGKKSKSPIEQRLLDAEYTKERFLSTYIPRLQEEKAGIEALSEMSEKKLHCLHFCGGAGCGKSALMASLEDSAKRAGAHTILYYSGNPGCQNIHTLKDVLVYRLEEILGKEHRSEIENRNEYLRELGIEAKNMSIFLFVDALDQLFAKKGNEYLDILEICPDIFVISSSLDDFPYEQSLLAAKNLRVVPIGKFHNQDKQRLIQKTCEYRGKKIDEVVRSQICRKEGSENPLFLSLLLQRLFAMRQEDFQKAEMMAAGMDGLHLYMEKIISETPQDIHQVAITLFKRIGEMFQSEFFETVANLIALSQNGLTELEIREILEMQNIEFLQLKFQEILFYLYDVFTENENGKWIYSHRIFYEALQENMGEEKEIYIKYFIDYSKVNPDFMEQEGYYHILSNQHPLGKIVLNKCQKWSSRAQIRRLVTDMLDEEKDISYFLEMLNGDDIQSIVEFWEGIGEYENNEKIRKIKKQIYSEAIGNEAESPEFKVRIMFELLRMESRSVWPEYFKEIQALLLEYKEEDQRILDQLKLEYEGILYQIYEKGETEAGCQKFDVYLNHVKSNFPNETIKKKILYKYIFGCQMYAYVMNRCLKQCVPECLLDALKMYEKYPELTSERGFMLTRIEIYLETVRHTKEAKYAVLALKESRLWADQEPCVETLELLGKALNVYGAKVEPEKRYQYRYESYITTKRIYQIAGTDYWKQTTADQAAFFAKDKTMPSDQLWILRRNEAWEICLKYFEELYESSYTSLDDTYLEECILNCIEQETLEGKLDQVVSHLGVSHRILKDRQRKGWGAKDIRDWNTIWSTNAGLIEQLDERLWDKEALDYVDEMIVYARKIYQVQHGVNDTIHLFYALKLAASAYYHNGNDELALKYALEGLEILNLHEKENQIIYPAVKVDLCYIIFRIHLKQGNLPDLTYLGEVERQDEKHLSKEQIGRKYLLQGDYLYQKEEYKRAKAFYEKAIVIWHEEYNDKKDKKAFFYYIYSIYQKAEAMLAGNIEDDIGSKNTFVRKLYGHNNAYKEYGYVFEQCLKKLKENEMVEISRRYMFKAIERLLAQKVSSDYNDLDQFNYLCQMASYCTQNGIDFTKEIQVLIDGLCKCDMHVMSIWMAFSKELEYTWLDIYPYIQERIENGTEILSVNYYLFAWMWFRFGCYEEAARCAAKVKETDSRYSTSQMTCYLSKGLCAMRDGDEAKLQGILKEIEEKNIMDYESCGKLSESVYYELNGSAKALTMDYHPSMSLQEPAQRYLNLIRIWTQKEKYFSLDSKCREKLWKMTRMIRESYFEGNTKHQESWEIAAKKMKALTGDEMTWKVDFKDVEREIYTVWGDLYCSLENLPEKKEIGKEIFKYWRENYKTTDLTQLSFENLWMLYSVEMGNGDIHTPALVAEISRRKSDKKILHDFFANVEEYKNVQDEIRELFDILLAEDVMEWGEDLRKWIDMSGALRHAGSMQVMSDVTLLAEDPDKEVLYQIYRSYVKQYKEEMMKGFSEKILKG